MAASKPRIKVPKSATKGEVIEIKTLISHVMETGTRKDKDGKPIPRDIINKFTATFNGKEVFAAKLHPSISANPYIAFFVRAEESGTFEFTWTDDAGTAVVEKAEMKVG